MTTETALVSNISQQQKKKKQNVLLHGIDANQYSYLYFQRVFSSCIVQGPKNPPTKCNYSKNE